MTKNSRIKFLLICAISLITIIVGVIIFQLVKIIQYENKLEKLEKQIKANNNIIAFYEDQANPNNSDNKNPDEQIEVN